MDEIHPFQLKSGYRPHFSCNTLENYIFQNRHELSSLQIRKFRDNLSILERKSIISLLNDKNIIIKKADKIVNCVILDKVDYLSEVHRQLSTYHYKQIENFDFKDLRMRFNSYLINMHTKDGIEGNSLKYGPGYIHILPKIHRLDQLVLQNIFNCGINIDQIIPPGRPIISQIGSVTEYIGHYIDHFLLPIVQNQCTYIKDTTYFINKI